MRKITREITGAFLRREELKIGNSQTDGTRLYLFGNRIAMWFEGRIWIRTAGWQTSTTKDRLNALPDVHIYQRDFVWYLNGQQWDGRWICPSTMVYFDDLMRDEELMYNGLLAQQEEQVEFDLTNEWTGKFDKPKYAVFHTNKEEELGRVEEILKTNKIPCRRMESDTVGEYKPNYFIVVLPSDVERSKSLVF